MPNKRTQNERFDCTSEDRRWEKLKTLVLDSVSSPITKRVYNMALDEFLGWFQQAPRPGFTKATVSAWRVSLEDRAPRFVVDHYSNVGDSQAGRRGRRQRPAGARVGRRHHPREERENAGHPHRQLAVAAAGAGAPERAGYRDACGGCATAPSSPCSWAAGCGGPKWRR